MINHFRTLLLNRSAPSYLSRHGEEYIPEEFSRLENLPSYIQGIRTVLFGPSSDWLFENYRVRQYMSVLHSTELEEFVTALDSRITYDPWNPEFFSGVFGPRINKHGLRLVGSLPPPDDSGQCIFRWKITLTGPTTADVEQITPKYPVREVEYKTTPIAPGLWMQTDETPGTNWTVEYFRRPERSLGEIVAALKSGTAQYWNDLFGVGSPRAETEPFKTFRNLWLNHPELPYKLGGLLLALVYATEARR